MKWFFLSAKHSNKTSLSRRLRGILLIGLFLGIVYGLYTQRKSSSLLKTVTGQTMGTTYTIRYFGRASSSEVKTLVDERLHEINAVFSTYIADSEVCRFNNHKSTEPFKVSERFGYVTQQALAVSEATDGAFDITVASAVKAWGFLDAHRKIPNIPSASSLKQVMDAVGYHYLILDEAQGTLRKKHPNVLLDFSAIAKGYAVDEISLLLAAKSIHNHLVEIGGELKCMGTKSKHKAWRVGIQEPSKAMEAVSKAQIPLQSGEAIATSGDYANTLEAEGKTYIHIIVPQTGSPAENTLASVSVITSSCMLSDAYATALMVMGKDKALRWATQQNLAFFFIERIESDTEHSFRTGGTPSFMKRLKEPTYESRF